jgi:hypothetical protein
MFRSSLSAEYVMTVLDDKLDGVIFGVHVGHLAVEVGVSHNRGSKDNGQVLGCHLRCVSICK